MKSGSAAAERARRASAGKTASGVENKRADGRERRTQRVDGRDSQPPTLAASVNFGPMTEYIGYSLRRAHMTAVTGFLEGMKEVDLRPTQFAVLILINENPGVRQTEVCAALGIQKANFVPLLNELQRRGLAERKEGIADRRSSALHLTQHGLGVLRRAEELHSACEERLAARLGPRGRDQLVALLKKLG